MNKNITAKILISISIISIGISSYIVISQTLNISRVFAVFPSTTQNEKIKILIVPGHEPNAGGADEFKKIKERDLNLQLSLLLKNALSSNPKLEIILARDENGWNNDLKSYILTSSSTIMNWV